MTTTHIIMAVIIISGVVLGVFTAIEHITGHSKNRRSYFRFVRGLIVSLLMGQLAVIGFGLYERHPSLCSFSLRFSISAARSIISATMRLCIRSGRHP